jgi:hypothetical protein
VRGAGGGEKRRQRHQARLAQHRFERGALAERPAQRRQIARPAAAEAEPGQSALDIGAVAQPLAQPRSRIRGIDKKADRIEAGRDRRRLGQGCREMLGQEPSAGRGPGTVDRRQQAAAALARRSRRKLEVAPRRGVDLHDRARSLAARRFEMRRRRLLGQADVIDQGAGRRDLGAAEIAKAVKCLDPVKAFETPARRVAVKARIGQRRQRRLPFGEQIAQGRTRQQPLGQQYLTRHQPCEITRERALRARGERESAGRQIEPGETDLAARLGKPGEVVVAARVEEAIFGQGARGHHPHDGAPHRPFGAALLGLGGVLDLVADRHLEAGTDQTREIGFGGMDRHAAHRDVGAVMPAALGQRDVESLRGSNRVVEEQLEKIPHAEK